MVGKRYKTYDNALELHDFDASPVAYNGTLSTTGVFCPLRTMRDAKVVIDSALYTGGDGTHSWSVKVQGSDTVSGTYYDLSPTFELDDAAADHIEFPLSQCISPDLAVEINYLRILLVVANDPGALTYGAYVTRL